MALAALVLAALAVGVSVSSGAAQAPSEKVVRVPFPQYDGSLSPYTFEIGYPLVTLVYDTLMLRDADGVPRPWLARSVRRSEGASRVTVRLRRGVRWHDGRPLTADDVAFTFRFVAERAHPRFTTQVTEVESVRAVDRLTVVFDLRRPALGFEDQPLADVPILPRHLWEGLPPDQPAPNGLPVGSGPYRLVRSSPRRGYVFQANDGYFKGRPTVGRIEMPIIRDEERSYTALRRRQVDMLPFSLPKDPAEDLGGAFGINLETGPSYLGTALLLNLRRPPFDEPAVRRAVARALDLGRLVRNVGPAVPADRGYIHPASPWAADAPLQRFDGDAARAAFARLGLPRIRVLAPDNDPVRLEAGRQVVLALRRAGASARLAELSRDKLGRAIGEDGASADFEAAIVTSPSLASYDPSFLDEVFGSDSETAPLNYAGYRSAAFDALADRVAGAADRPARKLAVGEQLRLLARDLPVVPLLFSRGTFGYRPAAHEGWLFIKGSGILDKRSFLPAAAPSRGQRAGSAAFGETGEGGGSLLDLLDTISLIVLVLALAVGGVALARRLSIGRR